MSVEAPPRKRAAIADPEAREFLRNADPVLARLIDARPDFRPRAWMEELPPLDAFGSLIFGVAGQQLSVSSTRAIISHLQERFGGNLPSPAELLAADPQVLRDSGFSARKGETLRALAERFVDGRLSEDAFASMTDEEIEVALTDVSGIGPWTARGFLLVAMDRPDVFLSGDLALRRPIQREYGLDHLPTEEELAGLSDPWRPYRSLAVSYLFASEYEGPTMTGPHLTPAVASSAPGDFRMIEKISDLQAIDPSVDHVRGPEDAPLLVEYGDYECPYSRRAFREIERAERRLEGRVRFVFRHFPLTEIHPHAMAAAAAAEAAARQDRFWEMHGRLFHGQRTLEDEYLRRYARDLGLDVERFDADRASEAVHARIRRDIESGVDSGEVRGTPTLFVNESVYRGPYDALALVEVLSR
jgi:DNA-3-methyladenine glycosylase II